MSVCEGLCEYMVKDKDNTFCPPTPLRHDPKEYDIKAGNDDQYLIYATNGLFPNYLKRVLV